jgi:hypothetical protein
MHPIRPVLVTTALAASLLVALPVTAYAGPPPVTDAVILQLHAIDTASLNEAANGFTETSTFNAQTPATLQFDPAVGIRQVVIPLGGGPVVKQLDKQNARCRWLTRDAMNRAAAALAGTPSAEWVCTSVPGNPGFNHDLSVGHLFADTSNVDPAPQGLPEVVDSAVLTGTEADGTWDVTSHEAVGASVLHRSYQATVVAGLVTAVHLSIHLDNDTPDTISDSIDYTAPGLTAPLPSHTISASRLALARDAVTLRQRMARYATSIAVNANAYAVKRGRVSLVRDVAGWTRVTLAKNPSGLVVHQSARRGVVLYGRNPFSRELVSYSVLVNHGRATVARVA